MCDTQLHAGRMLSCMCAWQSSAPFNSVRSRCDWTCGSIGASVQVRSTLTSVELPMGDSFVPDMAPINRARSADLNKPLDYRLAFTRGPGGRLVLDRRYNTAALLAAYYGGFDDVLKTVSWNISDPNDLAVALPGGGRVATRVTRRLQEAPGPQRLDTSEYLRQTFASPEGQGSRVKASQCFTKYKWRSAADAAAAGGVQIVATQARCHSAPARSLRNSSARRPAAEPGAPGRACRGRTAGHDACCVRRLSAST